MAFPLIRSSQFDVENALCNNYKFDTTVNSLATMDFQNVVTIPHRFNIGKVKSIVCWVEAAQSAADLCYFVPMVTSVNLSPAGTDPSIGASGTAKVITGETTYAATMGVPMRGFTTAGALFVYDIPQTFTYDEKFIYLGITLINDFTTTNKDLTISAFLVDQASISVYDDFKKTVLP